MRSAGAARPPASVRGGAAPVARLRDVVFTIVGYIMRLAPLAVFGATAHLVGEYNLAAMSTYGKLIAVCYGVALLFLLLLGLALKAIAGLSLWRFARYTREELLLALGTGSSETVMPRMTQSAGGGLPGGRGRTRTADRLLLQP